MIIIARWILTAFFGISFVWIASMNGILVVRRLAFKQHTPSALMIIGGVFGLIAVLVCPLPSVHRFWPVPLFADYGCAPVMLYAALFFSLHALRERRSMKRLDMILAPNETQLDGKWITKDGYAAEDDVAKRIHMITENHLTRICASWDGWSTLYQDPRDDRFWELYLSQERHGSGPQRLCVIASEDLDPKYGVNPEDPFGPRRTILEPSKRDLPPEIIAAIKKGFAPSLFDSAEKMLKRARVTWHLSDTRANLQTCARVQLAAIRNSGGEIGRLEIDLLVADGDWRDLLANTGLANEDWRKILEAEGYEIPNI